MNESSLQSLDADGRGLRLTFVRQGDRYGHAVELIESDRIVPLLESIEGDNADAWPPSPPLQSLSIERRSSGDVALLVGMAGRSHWSLSVEAIPGEGRLVFDAACRVGGEAMRLGSGYQTSDAAEIMCCFEARTAEIELGGTFLDLTVSRGEAPVLSIDGLEIAAQWEASAKSVRWTYSLQRTDRVCFSDHDDL